MAERPVTALTGGQATEAATLTIVKSPSSTLDQLLEQVDSPAADAEAAPSARAAQLPEPPRLVLVRGLRWMSEQQLEVAFRTGEPFAAVVAAEVDRELLNQAMIDGQMLLSEWPERGTPLVVGVVHSKPPSKVRFAAEEIELDASRELLLRSGSAALRLRSSGEVELVGSRISAVSRGVMRLIGRLLRLN
ncbi:MAG TPA: hypothetical protein VER96_28045 [Polyangiaceae bacterium]|nr:hypothetical protein [Polyangiaceae bacterium]